MGGSKRNRVGILGKSKATKSKKSFGLKMFLQYFKSTYNVAHNDVTKIDDISLD